MSKKEAIKKCLSDATIIRNKIKYVEQYLEDYDKRLSFYKL